MGTHTAASIYLRLSKDAGDGSQTGLDSQEEDLRALAASLGAEVVRVHTDSGLSGALRDRPGLLAWLADAREGRASVLLAYSLDRITRGGIVALAEVLDTLETSGARLLTTRDALDSDSAAWRLQAAVLSEVARSEREAISARSARAYAARKAAGRHAGGSAPFGTRSVSDGHGGRALEVDETEAEALRGMLAAVLDGQSLTALARTLTGSGISPRRSAAWRASSVKASLLNETAGRLIFSAAERKALKDALSSRRERYADRAPARKDGRLLSGLLRCSGCGSALVVGRRSDGAAVYRCNARGQGLGGTHVAVSAEVLEAWTEAEWLRGWGAMPETETATSVVGGDALAEAEEAVARLSAEVLSTRGAARLAALEALEAAEAEAERLQAEPARTVRVLRETGRTYAEAWQAGTAEARRGLLAETLQPMTVLPGRRGVNGFNPDERLAAWRETFDPAGAEEISA